MMVEEAGSPGRWKATSSNTLMSNNKRTMRISEGAFQQVRQPVVSLCWRFSSAHLAPPLAHPSRGGARQRLFQRCAHHSRLGNVAAGADGLQGRVEFIRDLRCDSSHVLYR
jgi:hypothetical protein